MVLSRKSVDYFQENTIDKLTKENWQVLTLLLGGNKSSVKHKNTIFYCG